MRTEARALLVILAALGLLGVGADRPEVGTRAHVQVRGIYGGVPAAVLEGRERLEDYGVNAVWIGSASLDDRVIATLHDQGARVFAEFNTMHEAEFLEAHPDAAPVGPDGQVSPPPDGWQGVCPTHPGYRRERMEAFRQALAEFEIDGIWLDYHHAHANWERAEPLLPDTCFCPRCLNLFREAIGQPIPEEPGRVDPLLREQALGELRERWVQWRCGVFTDWVREFREIRDAVRPAALLGTFHCPWSEDEYDGALREKLAIDLKAQAAHLDVFSPMPYHARFGHADDPAWISRQTSWLGRFLGIEGTPREPKAIWPIVQLSDWGESVPASTVAEVLDHGTRPPATGVMVFAWGSLERQPEKVERMREFYREIRP